MTECDTIDLQTLLASVPYKVMLSLEKYAERRALVQAQLENLNIRCEWKIPVGIEKIEWGSLPPIFKRSPKYASHAVTMLEMLDEVESRGVESFMHIEDDVIFHPKALNRLPLVRIPRDWAFVYVGGRNCGQKKFISSGLVKSNSISDLHAVIIRSDLVKELRAALLDPRIHSHWCDSRVATLHRKYPAYLCRPNLAWQAIHPNDSGAGIAYSNYYRDGTVRAGLGN